MNVVFLSSHTFLTKEVENALRKRTDLTVKTVQIPQYPDPASVENALDALSGFLPALVIAINDAGFDYTGEFQKRLIEKGCRIATWYHDYPFYEEQFQGRVMRPQKESICFTSEESFVDELTARGFNAYFLPLAVDPSYFPPDNNPHFERDVSFTGNSSSLFIDTIITEKRSIEVEKILPVLGLIKKTYYQNPMTDIRALLLLNRAQWENKTTLPENELLFILEWLCGYFYRRDFIVAIANRYQNTFMCYGDADWQHFIKPDQVSTEACYYTTLHQYYKSTKVNLNINRIQIRTSFTQRIFDCSACGAFVLTDRRAMNHHYFKTSGPDQELVEFSSLDECCKLIDYFATHDQERIAIAQRAQKKVLAEHTYDLRIQQLLTHCKQQWGI